VIAVDEKDLRFEGVHARHDLPAVPQALALSDRESLDQTLGNPEYWRQRKIEGE
jgi:hypothetical protein